MKIFYADHFVLPLPAGHRFPMDKYRRLRERVQAAGLLASTDLQVPDAATDAHILQAHTADYLQRVKEGLLSTPEVRRIGFPWSPGLVERSRRSAGATIAACRAALQEGYGANLAGGTHHAGPDWGQGFCVFNDSAIAARVMQVEGLARQVMVIDCDVHQGNGTAAILANDPSIFTFSIHGARNFPFKKETSDLDIGLADETDDETYLAALEQGLARAFERMVPELVIYIAGADPFELDRFGRLKLSKVGLARRDDLVLHTCRQLNVPVAVTMGGGYAPNLEDIVDIHFQTIAQVIALSRLDAAAAGRKPGSA